MSVRLAVMTHPGGLPSNEDACEVVETRTGSVLIIADGAGGHAHGEVASAVVVQSVKSRLASLGRFQPSGTVVEDLLRAAQEGLREEIAQHPTHFDMRSTAVIVLATRDKLWVGHVGDSRAYLVRDGKARLLTRDDTLVQTLVDIGQIGREAAKKHSKANVLLQSIGDPREIEYHVSEPIDVQVGDVVLACSDGVSDVIADEDIAGLVAEGKSSERARRVIDCAIERKSPDNVTAAVAVWRRSNGPPSVAVRRGAAQTAAARRRKTRDIFPLVAAASVLAAALGAAAVAKARHNRALAAMHATAPVAVVAPLHEPTPTPTPTPPEPPQVVEPAPAVVAANDAAVALASDAAAVAPALPDAAAVAVLATADAGSASPATNVLAHDAPTTATLYLVDLADDASVFVNGERVTPSHVNHAVTVPSARRILVRIHRPGEERDQEESLRIEAGHSFRLRAIRHPGAVVAPPPPHEHETQPDTAAEPHAEPTAETPHEAPTAPPATPATPATPVTNSQPASNADGG